MKTEIEYWTSSSSKKWRLFAITPQGASVEFWGKTKKEATAAFDREYTRKGFTLRYIHYKN